MAQTIGFTGMWNQSTFGMSSSDGHSMVSGFGGASSALTVPQQHSFTASSFENAAYCASAPTHVLQDLDMVDTKLLPLELYGGLNLDGFANQKMRCMSEYRPGADDTSEVANLATERFSKLDLEPLETTRFAEDLKVSLGPGWLPEPPFLVPGRAGPPLLRPAFCQSRYSGANAMPRTSRFATYPSSQVPSFCQVCQDVAAGYHCGCYVCEACKKFFVRSARGANAKYSCANSGQCLVTRATRTRCQQCRYQKCLQLGMTLPGEKLGAQSAQQESPVSETPCRVCAAPSSGFHFGAVTCEGCKGFFRRSVKEREPAKYVCPKNGDCEVTQANRNLCKYCRFRKCIAVGMDPNGSRIGRQPATSKRKPANGWTAEVKCETNSHKDGGEDSASHNGSQLWQVSSCGISANSTSALNQQSTEIERRLPANVGSTVNTTSDEDETGEASDVTDDDLDGDSASDSKPVDMSDKTQKTIVPSEKWTEKDFSDDPDALERMEREICIAFKALSAVNKKAKGSQVFASDDRKVLWDTMMVQFHSDALALTSFSKHLPFFNLLETPDKLALVRTGMYHICQTLLSRDFNLVTGDYNYYNFDIQEREKIFETFPAYRKFEAHFLKMRAIRALDLDPVETALFCALQLFSVNSCNDLHLQQVLTGEHGLMSGIQNFGLVSRIQKQIDTVLIRYCLRNGKGIERYSALIEKLEMLYTLDVEHQDIVTQVRKANPKLKFPELYLEMFNMQ